MKKKRIKKGNHYSFSLPRFYIKRTRFSYLIKFTDSCKYDIGEKNQADINKLFGISFGHHHNNSARFGWRWNPKKNSIELLAYVYVNGERIKKNSEIYITDVKLNQKFKISFYLNKGKMIFLVNIEEKKYKKIITHGKLPFWGYKLNPYFGGRIPAPHDIIIEYSIIH
jgi:hypothetical protein